MCRSWLKQLLLCREAEYVTAIQKVIMMGEDKFKKAHPDTSWEAGLDHGVKIGLGSREYELITV